MTAKHYGIVDEIAQHEPDGVTGDLSVSAVLADSVNAPASLVVVGSTTGSAFNLAQLALTAEQAIALGAHLTAAGADALEADRKVERLRMRGPVAATAERGTGPERTEIDRVAGITTFREREDGTHMRQFDWGNVRVSIQSCGADDSAVKGLAERLHRYLTCKPEPLLGTGCVRFDERSGRVWLLGGRERGWGAYGVECAGWDDLFRRYAVVIGEHGVDGSGPWWEAGVPASRLVEVSATLADAAASGMRNRETLVEIQRLIGALLDAHPEAGRG